MEGSFIQFTNLIVDGYTIHFNSEYADFFVQHKEDFQRSIKNTIKLLNTKQISYKDYIKVQSVYFLLGAFYKEKEIIILSKNAGREIILNELGINSHGELTKKLDQVKKLPELAITDIEKVTILNGLVDFSLDKFKKVDEDSIILVEKLAQEVSNYHKSLFERLSDFGLNLTAQYDLIRVHILKFLAILPSLDYDISGKEIKRVLQESIRRLIEDNEKLLRSGKTSQALPQNYILALKLASFFIFFTPSFLLALFVRFNVKLMAKRFIAGETIEKSVDTIHSLAQTNRDVTLDQLGELVVSHKEADHYCAEVIKIIKGINHHIKRGSVNAAQIKRAHVSIKVSALSPVFKPHAFDFTYNLVAPRLIKILLAAKEEDVFVNIDAEHYHFRDLVLKIYAKVLLETKELQSFSSTGIVVQCYLKDASTHLLDIVELAKKRKIRMPIRLVKGAYWDAETIEARAHSFETPQFLNKEETDIHYRQLIYLALEHYDFIQIAVASHNIQDNCFAESLRTHLFPKALPIEHQCLHMTYEALSFSMAKMGWPVRNYMPIGSLIVGMAYLVRRIMENSSQVGILSMMRRKIDPKSLETPTQIHQKHKHDHLLLGEYFLTNLTDHFTNMNPVRFYLDQERYYFDQAHKDFKRYFQAPLEFGQEFSGQLNTITCPFDENLVIGQSKDATIEDLTTIISSMQNSIRLSDWGKNIGFRISCFLKLADLLALHRFELANLIVYEAGKTFNEALADVDEAIDFCAFYSREEKDLMSNPNLGHRNLVAVISPWNFPLAIPCGMVVGALVSGNHVILKSSEETPLISWMLSQLIYLSGVPKSVYKHVTGKGEVIGKHLVEHPLVEAVVFTGSKTVGEWIYRRSFEKAFIHKLKHQPKVITEMGGKNAIIVTANAELDETVSGILYSAFAHAGQKCSAASRIIVDSVIKDKLIARLKDAVNDIQVGPSSDPSVLINTLINKHEKNRLIKNVEDATKEAIHFNGEVVVDRSKENFPGGIIGPVVISIPTKLGLDKSAFSCRELFGPVIHIIPYKDLDQAIEIFNITDYGLTGGIYSQSQDDIDYLSRALYAGNLYINRPNTGARVGIEPFGGFKMSGTGPKAGSKDYVRAFHREINEYEFGTYLGDDQLGMNHQITINKSLEIDIQVRKTKLLRFLEQFQESQNYKRFPENTKKLFLKNKTWIEINYELYLKEGETNTIIPGQLSYNDHQLNKGVYLVITQAHAPNFQLFQTILAAILAQSPVKILVNNSETLHFWNEFISLLWKEGFDQETIEVIHLSHKALLETLKYSQTKIFYLDCDLVSKQNYINAIFSNQYNDFLPTILSNQDHLALSYFADLMDLFILIRSFAVNVMRHGAPLNIEVEK